MSILCEQLVARVFREYMLAQLPAKVTEVNGTRAAVLKSARLATFNVLAGMKLHLSFAKIDGPFTDVPLTAGAAQTAAQVAADVNAVFPGTASIDTDGRVLLTSTTAPTAGNSIVSAGKDTTGANALLGWPAGGERAVMAPLVCPTSTGVADGLPFYPDMGPGFWLIIGKRMSRPVARAGSTVRTYEYQVGFELGVMYRETNVQSHRSREAIGSCVRCVRELLLTPTGRQLGRAGSGDITLVEEKECTVEGTPFAFKGADAPKGLFDRARMLLAVRVFERAPT